MVMVKVMSYLKFRKTKIKKKKDLYLFDGYFTESSVFCVWIVWIDRDLNLQGDTGI